MTPDLDAIVELRKAAHEAMSEGWYQPGFLRAFIDDDDDEVFTAGDAWFISLATPSTVLVLTDRLAALEGALREAADFLELRPYGHVGPSDIPWFTHGVISHDKVRPDCVVCQWLARYAALTPDPDSEETTP